MQKIMFNDKYGLTEAVLTGRKTQTRRIIPSRFHKYIKVCEDAGFRPTSLRDYSNYKLDEVVAIAQSYKEVCYSPSVQETVENELDMSVEDSAGWNNKMFVKANLMPHHIKITNIRVERLQDISCKDCIAEGIEACGYDYEGREIYRFRYGDKWYEGYRTEKEAYASLIDKVGKKGTWDSNPWVFVYCFELVD